MKRPGPVKKDNALRRDPEYLRSKTKKWREANPEAFSLSQEKSEAKRKVYYRNNPELYLWKVAKHRAKKINIPFTITVDDVVIPEVCPILQIPIDILNSNYLNGASLDRVHNSLGYIPGNVRVISRKANRMKNDASLEQLERILLYMKGMI